jgi:hypothetical protein
LQKISGLCTSREGNCFILPGCPWPKKQKIVDVLDARGVERRAGIEAEVAASPIRDAGLRVRGASAHQGGKRNRA